jgi:hypothetical protein
VNLRRTLATVVALAAAAPLSACTSPQQDQPADAGPPTPLGNGERISEVMNPSLPTHPASGATVTITGASFLMVDTFDETGDGKSVGTVYLQDTGSNAPYSGASLYDPAYNPSNLSPAPGDVLDLVGQYDVDSTISTFPAGEALIQISKPQVKFRFEYLVPPATVIDVTDLNDYGKGLQWSAMLVTVNDVTLGSGLQNVNGRVTAYLTSTLSGSAVEVSNELFDLATWNSQQTTKLATGAKIKSLTGIVTWFEQFHIAPRSPADIVLE